MVILNASLQVMPDPGAVLERLRRALAGSGTGGVDSNSPVERRSYLLVMNTPLHADGRIDLPGGEKSEEPLLAYTERTGFETVVHDRSLVYLKLPGRIAKGRLVTGGALSRLLSRLPTGLTLAFPWILLRLRR